MASIINASTTGAGGLITTADNTGNLNLQSNGTTVLGLTSTGVAVTGTLTQNGSSVQAYNANLTEYGSTGVNMRNRIINGDMRIDQRNAGASLTITANPQYTVDRWFAGVTNASKISVQQSSTAPSGFTKSMLITSLAATTPSTSEIYYMQQSIEGFNVADLDFGLSTAKTITLSFWVRSSLTGTFGAVLLNAGSNRSFPFNYTISSANTWTQITQTITGDTTGTWYTDNTTGFQLRFGLGAGSTYQGVAGSWGTTNAVTTTTATNFVGTNGATLYITGVQLEVGSTATPFERRQYGQELALCHRYYQKESSQVRFCYMRTSSDNWRHIHIDFKVAMRTTPTFSASLTAGSASSDYQTNMSADAYRYYANTSTADYVTTWTADAEL